MTDASDHQSGINKMRMISEFRRFLNGGKFKPIFRFLFLFRFRFLLFLAPRPGFFFQVRRFPWPVWVWSNAESTVMFLIWSLFFLQLNTPPVWWGGGSLRSSVLMPKRHAVQDPPPLPKDGGRINRESDQIPVFASQPKTGVSIRYSQLCYLIQKMVYFDQITWAEICALRNPQQSLFYLHVSFSKGMLSLIIFRNTPYFFVSMLCQWNYDLTCLWGQISKTTPQSAQTQLCQIFQIASWFDP